MIDFIIKIRYLIMIVVFAICGSVITYVICSRVSPNTFTAPIIKAGPIEKAMRNAGINELPMHCSFDVINKLVVFYQAHGWYHECPSGSESPWWADQAGRDAARKWVYMTPMEPVIRKEYLLFIDYDSGKCIPLPQEPPEPDLSNCDEDIPAPK